MNMIRNGTIKRLGSYGLFAKRHAYAISISLAVLSITFGVVLAIQYQTAEATEQQVTPAVLTEHQEWRRSFGLDTSPLVVASVAADPASRMEYGIPLTLEEVQLLDDRNELFLAVLDPIQSELALEREYAGIFVDQSRGAVIVVRATSATPAIGEIVQRYSLPGLTIDLSLADYSVEQLRSAVSAVEGEWSDLLSSGIELVSLGIDERANRVLLGVADLTATHEQTLRSKFGPTINVVSMDPPELAACTSRAACTPPTIGGINTNSPSATCTTGFIARTNGSLVPWILTAGHCFLGSTGQTWTHNSSTIGTGAWQRFVNGSNADVAGIAPASGTSISNKVYASSTLDVRSITSTISNASQSVGTTVCRAGRVSGYTCGQITVADESLNFGGGKILHHFKRSNISSAVGDSGGSMILVYGAAGILSSINVGITWHSTVDWILADTNVRICLDPLCN